MTMLNAGIVGLGRWGRTLVRSVGRGASSERIVFQAGYTKTPARHAEFADEEGLQLFGDYEEMLASGQAGAVVIASPHSEHVEQIRAAAAAGLHVFVEKPMALDVASALAAITSTRAANVKLAVGFNRRFLPTYRRLHQIFREGRLGQLLHIEGNFSGPFGTQFSPDAWHANQSETPAGGMTLMGIHVLDAMIGIAGPIANVRARSKRQFLTIDIDDTTDTNLEFASGCTGYLSTMTATSRNWRLQLFGSKGWCEMRGYEQLVLKIDEDVKVYDFEPVDIERAELHAFADYVTADAEYPVPIEEVIAGIAALEAINRSCRENAEIDVE
ncbi:Gfo/Idh/MocA family oxidoreductase [Bosea sp. F3-2]|uniref:Gfo/Idh/MocA family protein n=1 Tax=Bosea sp. F3-2 TaxID=2599640 RepID=UPI0011ED7BA6|nr:Gfo/Idh/MocA family oxidoreductase [Bosea sp. F3-2]QEL22917.1 Gfo/Idh/MocA family oxidoreductase [Bosea sp. F3-2]